MRCLAGIALGNDPVLGETMVDKFRLLVEKHYLGAKVFEEVNVHLKTRIVRFSEGTIVDATHCGGYLLDEEQEEAESRNVFYKERNAVLLRDQSAHRSRQ